MDSRLLALARGQANRLFHDDMRHRILALLLKSVYLLFKDPSAPKSPTSQIDQVVQRYLTLQQQMFSYRWWGSAALSASSLRQLLSALQKLAPDEDLASRVRSAILRAVVIVVRRSPAQEWLRLVVAVQRDILLALRSPMPRTCMAAVELLSNAMLRLEQQRTGESPPSNAYTRSPLHS